MYFSGALAHHERNITSDKIETGNINIIQSSDHEFKHKLDDGRQAGYEIILCLFYCSYHHFIWVYFEGHHVAGMGQGI